MLSLKLSNLQVVKFTSFSVHCSTGVIKIRENQGPPYNLHVFRQRILMCSGYKFKKTFLVTQNSENEQPIRFPFLLVVESTSNVSKVILSTL